MTLRKKLAVIGYGNTGISTIKAIEKSPDFELAGVVRRKESISKGDTKYLTVSSIEELLDKVNNVVGAVMCNPSEYMESSVIPCLKKGLITVDSYDKHDEIIPRKNRIEEIAKANKTVAAVSSGWDPGVDSVLRAVMLSFEPDESTPTHTTFGPGRSMGHSNVAQGIQGIASAISITLPGDTPGTQKRLVYAKIENGYDKAKAEKELRAHDYFKNDQTTIEWVEDPYKYNTLEHGVTITRKTEDIKITYNHQLLSNPDATANAMIGSARAALIAKEVGRFGAFTNVEFPTLDYIPGSSIEEKLKKIKY